MRAIVLGAAAGGGFPQWNCGCPNCEAVRAKQDGFVPRTQDSLAVTAGDRFVLVNASPDVHAQIKATPALWPKTARHSPIAAVVLTNGDLDHVLGLFSLRESQPLAVYATSAVWHGLEASVFVRTLRRFEGQLVKKVLELDRDIEIEGVPVRAFAAPGKLPVHLVGHAEPSPEDNVGLRIGRVTYAAACDSLDGVDLPDGGVLLFDGTFYREDELVRLGLSKSVAKDMAHMPIEASMRALAKKSGRKIFTHINNTNPILAPSSEERRAVENAGWEIAYDGMEIES
jgi:pyrroloquinoline quinone biosynthesis protein B